MAARGQGAAEARLFAAEGARVVLGDVLRDEGRAVAESIGDGARFVPLDVREPASWDAAVATAMEHFGTVTTLVNNDSRARYVYRADLPERILRWLFETSDLVPDRRDPRFDDDLQQAIFGAGA